jgi:proline racemase
MSAKGLIAEGEAFRHYSITGTHFDARIIGHAEVAGGPAVIVTIAGQAWITGISQYGDHRHQPVWGRSDRSVSGWPPGRRRLALRRSEASVRLPAAAPRALPMLRS